MCPLKKTKYSEILDPFYKKWNNKNFKGFSDEEVI